MDQQILSLLYKFEKQLDNIGFQVSVQNDKISSLEKRFKLLNNNSNKCERLDGLDGQNETELRGRENFMNQMRDELDKKDLSNVQGRSSRKGVKKSESFKDKPSEKLVRKRRTPHTVPSDKEEAKRINSFQRECLSKAIQWNFVDLVNAFPAGTELNLPKWISKEKAKNIMDGSDRVSQVRRFLLELRKQDFVTMQEWLNHSSFEHAAVKHVWEVFEEFSDTNLNKYKLKCFRCKLSEFVNIFNMVDHLYTADIISDEVYYRVIHSKLPVGAQESLWKLVFQECERNVSHRTVIIAFKIALEETCTGTESCMHGLQDSLMNDIDHFTKEPRKLLFCYCKELCSESFHPITCLSSMSLANNYFSPPTSRKLAESFSSSEAPASSSSISSLDLDPEKDEKDGSMVDQLMEPFAKIEEETQVKKQFEQSNSVDEETQVKKTFEHSTHSESHGRPSRKSVYAVADYMFPTQGLVMPKRSRSRSKKSRDREKAMLARSQSSLDSCDGENKPELPPRRNRMVRSSTLMHNMLENKPKFTIKAENVLIGTNCVVKKSEKSQNLCDSWTDQ